VSFIGRIVIQMDAMRLAGSNTMVKLTNSHLTNLQEAIEREARIRQV
jgi:hypothetical protein